MKLFSFPIVVLFTVLTSYGFASEINVDSIPAYQPDALIFDPSINAIIGNNIYNTSGLWQTVSTSKPANTQSTIAIYGQNDGSLVGGLKFQGTGGNSGWDIKYTEQATGFVYMSGCSASETTGWDLSSDGKTDIILDKCDLSRIAPKTAVTIRQKSSFDVPDDLSDNSLKLPHGFPDTGIHFTKQPDGSVGHDFSINSYIASLHATREIYVNRVNGSDISGNGSVSKSYKTIRKALAIAQAVVEDIIKITVITNGKNPIFYQNEANFAVGSETINGKTIIIAPDDLTKIVYNCTGVTNLPYTLVPKTMHTYYAPCKGVTSVIDFSKLDIENIPLEYERKFSIAEVEATPGSWYTVSTFVYIHTISETKPSNNTAIPLVSTEIFKAVLGSNSQIVMHRLAFVGAYTLDGVKIYKQPLDYSNNRFVAADCIFAYSNSFASGTNGNGFSTQSIKNTILVNCIAAYNGKDGFSHHYAEIGSDNLRDYWAVEINCVSHHNGLKASTSTNNAFTIHEGANVLRVNCLGYLCKGPVFADVNGCRSVLINCKGYASSLSSGNTHAVFYFDCTAESKNTFNDITQQMTGTGYIYPYLLKTGESRAIQVEITPQYIVPAGSIYPVICSVLSDTIVQDTVKILASVETTSVPDALIFQSSINNFTGDNIYNTRGQNQTEIKQVLPGVKTVFYVKGQNDGNFADYLLFCGPTGSAKWNIKYFDSATGNDITAKVTGAGWLTPTVVPIGAFRSIKIEITLVTKLIPGAVLTLPVSVYLACESTKSDVVNCVAR